MPTNARNVFDHNTVQTPTLANGIAIYGGTDTTVSNNLVADTIREGSALHAGSRFGAHPFAGTLTLREQHDGARGHVRAELAHRPRVDLVLRARRSISGIQVTGDHYLDSHVQRDHAGVGLAA